MGKRGLGLVLLSMLVVSSLASPARGYQPLRIVDFPTAGLYARGEYGIDIDVYSEGGLLVGTSVGFASFLSFGITYGGVGVIGTGDPDMNPRPEVNVRARIIDEDVALPAIAVGFDSQGYGKYFDKAERYLEKSRGVYAVASKNWDLAGPLSLHGGINYSLENKTDHDPTFFFGLIKGFADVVDFAVEYDVASNDNQGPSNIVQNRGFLNASATWYVNDKFSLSLDLRDLAAKNKTDDENARKWNRGLRISYHGKL